MCCCGRLNAYTAQQRAQCWLPFHTYTSAHIAGAHSEWLAYYTGSQQMRCARTRRSEIYTWGWLSSRASVRARTHNSFAYIWSMEWVRPMCAAHGIDTFVCNFLRVSISCSRSHLVRAWIHYGAECLCVWCRMTSFIVWSRSIVSHKFPKGVGYCSSRTNNALVELCHAAEHTVHCGYF